MQSLIMPKRPYQHLPTTESDIKRNRSAVSQQDANKVTNFVENEEHIERLLARGITHLFPIQVKTFRSVLKGRDVIGRARTGTGKTLAFSLPAITRLGNKQMQDPRMLVILPTRELALQVNEEITFLAGYFDPEADGFKDKDLRAKPRGPFQEVLSVFCCYGGSSYEPLKKQVQRGIDILVGTPGRLVDALDRQILSLQGIQIVVIDEADKVLEMGFKPEVDRLLNEAANNPLENQYLLFSATLPDWVREISGTLMKKPKLVDVNLDTDSSKAAPNIHHVAIQVPFHERAKMLKNVINLYAGMIGKVVIFVDKKSVANSVALDSELATMSQVLHGDIVQVQRESALKGFREGRFRCLICTDVAARGIHVDDISLVIQMTLPDSSDTFIHRSGRTGRAGNSGISIIMHSIQETDMVRRIEREVGIVFEKAGVPQKSELIKSNAEHLVRGILDQDSNNKFKDKFHKNLDRLTDCAEQLLASYDGDAVSAVSRCIYSMMGENTAEDDSVGALSGRSGSKAFHIQMFDCEVRSKSFIFGVMKRFYGEGVGDQMRNIALTKDNKGAVFEIDAEALPAFEKLIKNVKRQRNFTIEELVKLPELAEQHYQPTTNFKNRRGGNQRGNYQNGGGRGSSAYRSFSSSTRSTIGSPISRGGAGPLRGRGRGWQPRGSVKSG